MLLMFLCLKRDKRNSREQGVPVTLGKTCNSCQKSLFNFQLILSEATIEPQG